MIFCYSFLSYYIKTFFVTFVLKILSLLGTVCLVLKHYRKSMYIHQMVVSLLYSIFLSFPNLHGIKTLSRFRTRIVLLKGGPCHCCQPILIYLLFFLFIESLLFNNFIACLSCCPLSGWCQCLHELPIANIFFNPPQTPTPPSHSQTHTHRHTHK